MEDLIAIAANGIEHNLDEEETVKNISLAISKELKQMDEETFRSCVSSVSFLQDEYMYQIILKLKV